MTPRPLYVGTYTIPADHEPVANGRGIYRLEFDPSAGVFAGPARCVAEAPNPTYLAVAPDRRTVHAATGLPDGLVTSFAVDTTGSLRPLAAQSSGGADPCHLAVAPDGTSVFVANYSSASIAALPVGADGGVLAPVAVAAHTGSGPHPARQTAPHPHGVAVASDGRFVYCADLGNDRVIGYRVGGERLDECTDVALAAGSGPRQVLLHPRRPLAFVVGELDSTVTVLDVDRATGALTLLAVASSLGAPFDGVNFPAELRVHPRADVLYCSNRGHDSITAWTIAGGGVLDPLASCSSGGTTPRSFVVTTDGRFLVVANQASEDVVVVALDPATGTFGDVVATVAVPSPVCLAWG